MCYKTNVKIKISFEKINSADLSIITLKQITSLFSSVEKKEENEMKIASKVEKNVVRISKIKLIKKIKRISKSFRSKECLALSNMISIDVAV